MFFGNPSPFARLAPPFSALTCTKESDVPPASVTVYFVAFFGGGAAALSDFQPSTIDYHQAAQNDDPSRIVILSDEPERRISLTPPTINISSRINSYAKVARNSSAMNTYAILELGSHSE
jgi:hypothetical protein